MDYKNVWFLKTEQPEVESSNDFKIKEVNLNYQQVQIVNRKYNTIQDLW